MRVPDEMVEAASDRLNEYGNERDWQKMRPGEMAGIALQAVLPMVRERLLSGEATNALQLAAGLANPDETSKAGDDAKRLLAAAFDAAFPEDRLDAAEGEGRR